MQQRQFGNIGDFIKIAFLRNIAQGRRLAVCWYLTEQKKETTLEEKHFDYLNRPGEFRHFSPEVFDALKAIVAGRGAQPNGLCALEKSGLLEGALFHRTEVPRRTLHRHVWMEGLVQSVGKADLVFLDPDNGIQGRRLTPKHVALREVAALRRPDRALVTVQRQSGRQLEAKYIAEQLQSIGCERLALIRFRLVASRYFIVADCDASLSERIFAFARKWGDWVKTYPI